MGKSTNVPHSQSLKHRFVPTLAFLAKYRKENEVCGLTYTESSVKDNDSDQHLSLIAAACSSKGK